MSFIVSTLDNMVEEIHLRATSHTRLRAHVHYTSSTLIGGKGESSPSSLHTTFYGSTNGVCEYKMVVKYT